MNRLAQWIDDEVAKATCEHDFAAVEHWPDPAFVCVRCGTKSYPRTWSHRGDLRHMPAGMSPDYVRLLKRVHELEAGKAGTCVEARLIAEQTAEADRIVAGPRMEDTP